MIAVPRRRLVAERAAADAPLELVDELRREAVRKHRERAVEHDAHHLPVAGDRVLARRRLRHPAEGAGAVRAPARRRFTVDDAREAERRSVGHRSGTAPRDVAERVAALSP